MKAQLWPVKYTLKFVKPDCLIYYRKKAPELYYIFRKAPVKVVRLEFVDQKDEFFKFQIYNAFTGECYPAPFGTIRKTDRLGYLKVVVHKVLFDAGLATEATQVEFDTTAACRTMVIKRSRTRSK